jgi:hypothetical protein
MKRTVLVASLLGASCGGSCVARGARVRTPRGERNIEDLSVGDDLVAVDPSSGELVATRLAAVVTADRECVRLGGEGWSLVCTSDHPLYDPQTKSWAPAGDWVLGARGDVLRVLEDGSVQSARVHESQAFFAMRDVFDLTVEHPLHNFVADSVLVHNKAPARPQCTVPPSTLAYQGEVCFCANGSVGEATCLDADGKQVQLGSCERCAPDAGP